VRGAPTGEEFVVADHVGISIGRREDVDALAGAMREAGFTPLFWPKPPPSRLDFIRRRG